jgi:hypothetical protein
MILLFDWVRFRGILTGNPTGFRTTAIDLFKGTSLLSVLVAVQNSLRESAATINYWVERKTNQIIFTFFINMQGHKSNGWFSSI